ncbi:MAG TPA: TIGR00269 family protein [Candidatus Nanoarchaeia archaeon]|nr:TIGR00269 family protein [Candidatus Nanoarchaeia archaeon]
MDIEIKVLETLKKIKLSKKDKIIVAMSGGKDSTVVAYLLKKNGYDIEGFHINLKIKGYSDRCLEAVKELCSQLNLKLHVYDIQKEMGSSMCYLRSGIQERAKGVIKNCAICGVIKKWIINNKVRQLKADKIATGHNLDDEAQTFLMNIFKGSPNLSANVGAISKNIMSKKFTPRIKPLFYIPEDEVRKYSKKMNLPVIYEKCPCAIDSYRIQVREFLNTLSNKDKKNIIKNFEELDDKIQKTKDTRINYCEICGEPSRNKICKKCQLMRI